MTVKYPPVVQGMHLGAEVPAESWVEFLRMCREYAAVARERRKARLKEVQATTVQVHIAKETT